MKKYFNTSGPNNLNQHYTLLREELIKKGLAMVRGERYFTIWAPRQTGKSTYFDLLARELEKEGYQVCNINIENFQNIKEEYFCSFISKKLSDAWDVQLNATTFAELYGQLSQLKNQRFVFIIDEIEGLNSDLFNQFFHTIRNCYHNRNEHSLKSVILVGVANITGVIQDNASPFNISDNLDIPYFTKEEIFELLGQHEAETSQVFSTEVKEKINAITVGQPGLVNGFAEKLTKDNINKQVIDYEDYLKVEKWYLYEALDKNVANIVNKAKQHRAFIEKLLFTENKVPFTVYNDRIRYLYVNGLLKRDAEGNVEFWVPLYKKCLQQYFYPLMNGEAGEIQGNINIDDYFLVDGTLNMDKIMRGYQEYAGRRGFRYFIEKDERGRPKGLLEAGLMYSFETYIQSYLQVMKGKSYLEPHVALGRSDLIINIKGQEFVIEGKIYHNITQFTDGKEQLAYYMTSLGLTKGIYLVFVNSTITHPKVVEAIETFGEVELTTYLVRYDLQKDFTAKRKKTT